MPTRSLTREKSSTQAMRKKRAAVASYKVVSTRNAISCPSSSSTLAHHSSQTHSKSPSYPPHFPSSSRSPVLLRNATSPRSTRGRVRSCTTARRPTSPATRAASTAHARRTARPPVRTQSLITSGACRGRNSDACNCDSIRRQQRGGRARGT